MIAAPGHFAPGERFAEHDLAEDQRDDRDTNE